MATKKRKLSEETDASPIVSSNPGGVGNVSQIVDRPEAIQPVGRDDPLYNMTREKRGYVYIFKMEDYGHPELNRRGASNDARKCKEAFQYLQFEVKERPNLGKEEFLQELENIRTNEQLNNTDSLILVYMGHGRRDKITGQEYLELSDHQEVPTSVLWEPFSADKCPAMAGQPILYFIQACRSYRGSTLDRGILLKRPPGVETDTVLEDYVVPVHADMLIMWAAYTEQPAIRDLSEKYGIKGSVFFHFLCEVLKSDSESEDLASMLLTVTRKVGTLYETEDGVKQLPHVSSTLMRRVVFKKKPRELYEWMTCKEKSAKLIEMISTKSKQ